MVQTAKNWCFTVNNYTYEELKSLGENARKTTVAYCIFGKEIGSCGTKHLQGFISLIKRCGMASVKRIIGERAHLEVAKGTIDEATEYCKKDGEFVEIGIKPKGKGARTDLKALHDAIRSGENLASIRENHWGMYCRYERAIRSSILALESPREWLVDVRVYYGASGTGKTRKVYASESRDDIYSHAGGQWFDGYEGHEAALFDDFGGSEFKLTYLLKLLDRYPMRVPIKGGFVQWKPKRIYITSNYSPDEWFPTAKPEHVKALKRRLTEVLKFEQLLDGKPQIY